MKRFTTRRNEDCAACGCMLTLKDGNVCPACGQIGKAVPHKP